MPADHTSAVDATVDATNEWLRWRHLVLRPADAVECGFSPEVARRVWQAVLPGREAATAAEVRATLDGTGDGTGRPPAAPAREALAAFAAMADEMLAYRIERARVVADYQPIRLTKVNLKRVKSEVTIDVLRALARDLGWTIREDEEGMTVAVEDLLPYFRRPAVRQLLDAKLAQCGRARDATADPSSP
ncbi:MAG: hypothetical protein AB1689_05120 [Thermodesulfobacteriota bacterium]